MNPIPLNKDIYNKAKELNIEQIELSFSGGHDEGYLNVNTVVKDGWRSLAQAKQNFDVAQVGVNLSQRRVEEQVALEGEIEKWAFVAYDYDGGGSGSDYGDNFVYNLIKNTVTFNHWRTDIVSEDAQESKMEIND